MPREQTAVERIKFALVYGARRPTTMIVPHFSDEGEDNGYFVNRDDELVSVSVADLVEMLRLIPSTT